MSIAALYDIHGNIWALEAVLREIGEIAPEAVVIGGAVVCGHTHMQFDRLIDSTRVINSGSVGKPFGEPGAFWLLIDGDVVQFRRTEYDTSAAAAAIRDSDFPFAEDWASGLVKPPSRTEAISWHESRVR